jgi:hypothetical protein
MKKPWLILLLAAGCGSRNNVGAGNGAEGIPPDLTPNLAAIEANRAVEAQALVERAMALAMPDAKDAQYRNVRAGSGGSACGEVSGRTTGGFRPFVVTPEGAAVIGTSAAIAWNDPSDVLADAYIRWCATPEELRKVAPAIQKAQPGASLPNLAAPPAETAAPVPPPILLDANPSKPPPPPPPPQIGSFFNSVQHKQ